MVRKSLTFVSFLVVVIAAGLLTERPSNLKAIAQTVVSQSSPSPAMAAPSTTQQKNYPVVEEDAWLNPFAKLPLNKPTIIGKQGSKQDLAVLSVDILNPPRTPPTIIIPKNSPRQYRLATQWKQNELRVYAYEIYKTCEASSCTERTDPSPVNQGLFRVSKRSVTCVSRPGLPSSGSGSLPNPSQQYCTIPYADPIVEPIPTSRVLSSPKVVMADDGTTRSERQLVVYIGTQKFILGSADGSDAESGVFPINTALAKALKETTSPVRVLTPSNWEAVINQDAVKSLNVLYQESGMGQKQR
jgi:hypothetical protein